MINRINVFRKNRGVSAIEFALVLPIYVFLIMAGFDYTRLILANSVIVNMAREGGNLSARTTRTPQSIIRALAETAESIDMDEHGMIYITKLQGRSDGTAKVLAHASCRSGDTSLDSEVWSGCSSWNSMGVCNMPNNPPVVSLDLVLEQGEIVYAAEVMYDYQPLFDSLFSDLSELHSLTLL